MLHPIAPPPLGYCCHAGAGFHSLLVLMKPYDWVVWWRAVTVGTLKAFISLTGFHFNFIKFFCVCDKLNLKIFTQSDKFVHSFGDIRSLHGRQTCNLPIFVILVKDGCKEKNISLKSTEREEEFSHCRSPDLQLLLSDTVSFDYLCLLCW